MPFVPPVIRGFGRGGPRMSRRQLLFGLIGGIFLGLAFLVALAMFLLR